MIKWNTKFISYFFSIFHCSKNITITQNLQTPDLAGIITTNEGIGRIEKLEKWNISIDYNLKNIEKWIITSS